MNHRKLLQRNKDRATVNLLRSRRLLEHLLTQTIRRNLRKGFEQLCEHPDHKVEFIGVDMAQANGIAVVAVRDALNQFEVLPWTGDIDLTVDPAPLCDEEMRARMLKPITITATMTKCEQHDT